MTPDPFKWEYVYACVALVVAFCAAEYFGMLTP
jgi:hypothetical protein